MRKVVAAVFALLLATSCAFAQAVGGGTSSFVVGSTIIAGAGTAAAPSITSTTDQTSGLFFAAPNLVEVSIGGTLRGFFNNSGFNSNTSRGPLILWGAASGTVPTLIPDGTATTTGIGSYVAGQLSFIGAGVEEIRMLSAAGSQGVWIAGSPGSTILIDKANDIGHGRFGLWVGDGTGGSLDDENYINLANTNLHIQLQTGSVSDIALFDYSGNTTIYGTLITAKGLADSGYSYATPATAGTVTLLNTSYHAIIDPAGTLAALTVNMPASPRDGQYVDVRFSQIVTALTVSGNGNSIAGNPTSAAVGSQFSCIYRATGTKWFC